MKKFLALLLALVMALSLFACGKKDNDADKAKVKVGFITLHDENSTYDLNFINAAKAAIKNLGLTDADYILKTNIPEGQECYDTACDLAENGCNIIFADSFGHEPFMIDAAKKYPDVQFCHSPGTRAHTEGLKNYHNAFASIYEGRYLAGIAAGMKLNEMIAAGQFTEKDAKIGYVGAFTYAEVISGYTSFYLGAKSVCPTATMEVTFTGSWYDEALEKEGAQQLIANGCKLISQHADSFGAPTACENAIKAVIEGKTIDTDWTGTLATGSVVLEEINDAVAAKGTAEAIEAAKAKLEKGELHVFDVSTFTTRADDTMNPFKVDTLKVNGDGHITSYMADVDTDANYTGDTEAIKDGYFAESSDRSAPYFDLQIDGITLLNTKM